MPDDTQLDLSQTIAALRRELDARTAERDEALAREAAMAEVVQAINSSSGDLVPVFDAILEKAHRLCGADYGTLFTYDGERFRPAAAHGASRQFAEAMRDGIRPGRDDTSFWRLVQGERLVHIHDMAEVATQAPEDPMPPRWSISPASALSSSYRCAKTTRCSAQSLQIVGRFGPSPTRRSRCSKISRRRR
jgi:hypothetical protein